MIACREPILSPHHPPKATERLIGSITPAHQPPEIKDELTDVDVFGPELHTEFEENAPQKEGIIHEVNERPRKEYLQKTSKLQVQVDSKTIGTKVFAKASRLRSNIEDNTKKGIKRHTYICYSEGDSGRIFK